MIQISKAGHPAPNILLTQGVAKRNDHINDYSGASAGYHLRSRKKRTKFQFDSSIYGHDDVKSLLKIIQSGKCCFCEAKISHIAHGDVEHFRPKAAYKQDEHSNVVYPGYYWLAYDWGNLYFSCQICNGREKKNFFPLSNNARRATPVLRDISNEDPEFIDPGGAIDPETQIHFINEIPTMLTAKGQMTITYLGLDRNELNEDRLESLDKLKSMERIVNLTADSANAVSARDEFYNSLRNCVQEDSEYSSMFKSNFRPYLALL